jgi:hypothetical protein
VDIGDFYDGNPRRREATEYSFGSDWRSEADPHHRWDAFWNEGTGEVYVMEKPVHSALVGWNIEDAKDDIRALAALGHRLVSDVEELFHPRQVQAKTGRHPGDKYKDALEEELTVEILATVESLDAVTARLAGWQDAMREPDGLSWLRTRVGP